MLAERYRAIQLLGQGISGRTFLCIDLTDTPSSLCVVKQSWQKNHFYLPSQIQALFPSVELNQSVPIPKYLDQFEQTGIFYQVQEYIPGENLAQVLTKKITFDAQEIWQILTSLLPVIQHIHVGGVIHGDIKPENIICRTSLEPNQNSQTLANLVLVDIGSIKISRAITALGSPYTAPEQLQGKLIFASDLYTLGVTCIHLITGIHPFNLFDLIGQQWIWQDYWLSDTIQPSEQWENQQLAKLLNRLIAPDLNPRFSSALEVMTEIQKLRRPKTMIPILKPIEVSRQQWKCSATLRGHHGLFASVNAIAIAPDGDILASASDDKTIRIWDIQTQKQLCICRGHDQFVKSVAFHPHAANILASGSRDGKIHLWDIQTGRIIQTLTSHKHSVNTVLFSPDGEMLASGSADKTVNLWDSQTGKIITSLRGHILGITALAFSSTALDSGNSKLLASASTDSTVQIWNLTTFASIHTLMGHTAAIRSIAFSPNGKLLATGGEDRTIRLWDMLSQQCIRVLSGHPWLVSALKFSADGEMLISGSWDKTVKLWDVNTGNEIGILVGHEDSVNCADITTDKNIIISGSNDNTIKIWKSS